MKKLSFLNLPIIPQNNYSKGRVSIHRVMSPIYLLIFWIGWRVIGD